MGWERGLLLLLPLLLGSACGASGSYSPTVADASYAEEAAYEERSASEGAERGESFAAAESAPRGDVDDSLGVSVSAMKKRASFRAASPVSAQGGAKEDSGATQGHAATSGDEQAQAAPSARKRRPLLIYEADLGLSVFRVEANLDAIEALTASYDGYLVTRLERRIVVRVPAETFEEVVEKVLEMGDVHRRQITAKDVTAEFHDLSIRLKNAVAVRDRLEALLAQAESVEDALQVERELARLTQQIEVMKGRLKLLSELSAYSTITVEFAERSAELKPRVELPFPWLSQLGLNHLLDL